MTLHRRSARSRLGALTTVFTLAAGLFSAHSSAFAANLACESPWSVDKAYEAGALVSHDNANDRAQWWNQGEVPGTSGVWGDGTRC